MLHPGRRDFLSRATMAAAGALFARPARAADSQIEVLLREPIGTVANEIYGHFVEHLGGVVYDGIWVGEGSRVPNVGGIRQSLVDHMRRLPPAVIRWPGGCFADSYDWRSGGGAPGGPAARTDLWAACYQAAPERPLKRAV